MRRHFDHRLRFYLGVSPGQQIHIPLLPNLRSIITEVPRCDEMPFHISADHPGQVAHPLAHPQIEIVGTKGGEVVVIGEELAHHASMFCFEPVNRSVEVEAVLLLDDTERVIRVSD